MRHAAQALARKGVRVFPCYELDGDRCACGDRSCTSPGKHPRTARGLTEATTNERRINAWWIEWPRAGIGIACGELVVIDVDVKRGVDGHATLARLEADLGDLPRGRTASTRSGGLHLYFRSEGVEIRNAAGCVGGPAPGVDVRGAGGYVLAPPTPGYAWTSASPTPLLPRTWAATLSAPRRLPAPSIDPPRFEYVAKKEARWVRRAVERECEKVAAAPLGTRNERLYDSAFALAGLVHTGAITEDEVARAVLSAANRWPSAERDGRKDVDTVRRGARDGVAHPRQVRLAG